MQKSELNDPITLPELIDIIIGFLSNDKPSLAACTLVCKLWLPSSRRILFNKINVHLRRRSLRDFNLLLETAPFIDSSIRNLLLNGFLAGESVLDPRVPSPIISLQLLSSTFSHLNSLESLRIGYVELNAEAEPHCSMLLLNAALQVRDLALLDVDAGLGGARTMQLLFHLFVEVRSLIIINNDSAPRGNHDFHDSDQFGSEIHDIVCPFPSVHTLQLSPPSSWMWFFRNLSQFLNPKALVSLKVSLQSSEDLIALNNLLREAGSNLENLSLGNYIPTRVIDQDWQKLNLSSCNALKSLSMNLGVLTIRPDGAFRCHAAVPAYLKFFISRIPSPLHRVSFSVCSFGNDLGGITQDFPQFNCLMIEEMLLQGRHASSLKEVEFEFSDFWSMFSGAQFTQEKKAAEEMLPKLHSRGLLRFSTWSEDRGHQPLEDTTS